MATDAPGVAAGEPAALSDGADALGQIGNDANGLSSEIQEGAHPVPPQWQH